MESSSTLTQRFQKLCYFDKENIKNTYFSQVFELVERKNRVHVELPPFELKFEQPKQTNSKILQSAPVLKTQPQYPPHPVHSNPVQTIPFRPNSRRKASNSPETKRTVQFQDEPYKRLKNEPCELVPASYILNPNKAGSPKPKSGFQKPFACPIRSNTSVAGGSEGKSEDSKISSIEEKLIEMIESEIITRNPCLKWDDIAGLEFAKKTVNEVIVWPLKRPDLFKGLRAPPKGLMLFGPPGTGKTMIGKAIASEVSATFFSISASSITSKWVGEGEKLVRVLFALAVKNQPSVIFIDEIDSLLSSRSDSEQDASRRIKTEFLVHLDGIGTNPDDRILLIGATNRPEELDSAMQRRLAKRMYIPLPNRQGRLHILKNLMSNINNELSEKDLEQVVIRSKGYSGSDMKNLCTEACMFPLRKMGDIAEIKSDEILPVGLEDFVMALEVVRASVSEDDVKKLEEWNQKFGSFKFDYLELDT